jgi:hypothetical protein
MMLYGSDLKLIKEKKLDSPSSGDLWSAQSVANGEKAFLRQQSASDQRTTYYWLASDTLLPSRKCPGLEGRTFPWLR